MKPPETISANTWSEQEALESRKEAAPLTPRSPAQTCDSEPRVGNTTKDSRDSTTRRSGVRTPAACCDSRFSSFFRSSSELLHVFLQKESQDQGPRSNIKGAPRGSQHLPMDTTCIVLQLIPACSITFRLSLSG